ncbi:hypothetical protein L596_030090 [Steinernema carpocapsae]|uniref:Homeobox domain-containing protein n=1 Tax=Steinernema carpocapsae TaxID=34508 RepID=A0A4V5ZX67_STECR|nr:hypothetical protein L596_030090 [Steinernema carpocapsae]
MDQNLFNQLRPFLDKSNLPLQPQLEPQLDQVLQDLLDKAANEHADKKPRTFFTEEEKFVYEAAYDEDPFFAQCPKNRAALALTFSRTERQIKKWFQNRRAIEKKEQEEEAVGRGLEDKVRKELHDS